MELASKKSRKIQRNTGALTLFEKTVLFAMLLGSVGFLIIAYNYFTK